MLGESESAKNAKESGASTLPYQLLAEAAKEPKREINDYATDLDDQDSLEIDLE